MSWTARGPLRVVGVAHPAEAESRGTQPWAVEPLPPRGRGCRADERAVRAARRDHRPQQAPRSRRAELFGPGHRQHGTAVDVRHRAAEEGVAHPVARGRDPFGLRHDRARRRVLGRHQHLHQYRSRRRRLRDQRPQVVHQRCDESQRQDPDRDGQDGSVGRQASPAEHDLVPRDTPASTSRAR